MQPFLAIVLHATAAQVDDNTWVKAGIEFTDGYPRLSCVVTNNGFSDWSTQRWKPLDRPISSAAEAAQQGGRVSIQIRVTKVLPGPEQGPGLVFEAAEYNGGQSAAEAEAQAMVAGGQGEARPPGWFQVRIARSRNTASGRCLVPRLVVQNSSS